MTDTPPTAIVTGANRGIGLAVATRLASEGYRIAACVRSASAALDTLIASAPNKHTTFALDLAEEDTIKAAAREVLGWTGAPDVLVNCAGQASGGLFQMTRMADMRALFQVNLFGTLCLSQYVAKKMLRQKSGAIINIASTAGLLSDAGTLAYGGSKAALIHATRVMATELGPFGIRVNAIAPSVVAGEMGEQMDEKARAALEARAALPGETLPEDIAGLAAYLASEDAAKLSGQVLRLDRGMTL
ncbi:SDR family NAD(P)-dependent oxidoreductase [Ruegeria arenilitoris]|uniref:SDR family NAD(P)-dependent oxidoreductase n=1 Tax=Ruegeria arenilitoris TaxID=1173585 RepID=UPI001C9740A9|nr:SDR family oxidoreductase [Ruegeria arenilitoris]MBY6081853.1 SDR family oxidoreductase [Ruegeria arenilitoris]